MNLIYTTQLKKDFKRVSKQGKDLLKLERIIVTLFSGKELEPKFRDHSLSGKWKSHRDCHIEPDWILIYKLTAESLILERTGSHSDLFK